MISLLIVSLPALASMLVLAATFVHPTMKAWGLHSAGVLNRRHLLIAAVALVIVGCACMNVALAGRIKLANDQEQRREEASARQREATENLRRDQITMSEVRQIANRTAVDIFNSCVKEPARTRGCRADLARAIDRVFRVTAGGRIVPVDAITNVTRRTEVVQPTRTVVIRRGRPVPGPRGPQGPPGPAGPQGPRGPSGRGGKDGVNGTVDSKALDTIDARVRDLELITGGLGRRLDRALGLLCPLVRALCR